MPLLPKKESHMFNFYRCLGVLTLLVSTCAHADLMLKMLPYTGSESQALKERLDVFTRKYVDEHSLVSQDYPYQPAENYKDYIPLYGNYDAKYAQLKYPETLYGLTINGRDYLAAVFSFNPMLTAEPHCRPNDSALPTGHCELIAKRQKTCHLFLIEPNSLALESVTPLNIVRDPRPMPGQKKRSFWHYNEKHPNDPRQVEGWPACSDLLAVATTKDVPDSLLFTLGYYDSAAVVDKFTGAPIFKTTVLVSISTDAKGKPQVTQDDSCLGNPNMYTSIGEARKALKQCASRK